MVHSKASILETGKTYVGFRVGLALKLCFQAVEYNQNLDCWLCRYVYYKPLLRNSRMNLGLRIQLLIPAILLSIMYSLWTPESVSNSLQRLPKAVVRALNIWPYATSIHFWKHQSSVEVIIAFRIIIRIRSKTLLMHIIHSSNKTLNTWKIEDILTPYTVPQNTGKANQSLSSCLVRLSRLFTLAGFTVLLIVLLIISSRVSHRGALRHLSSDCLLPHNTNKSVIVVCDSAEWARNTCST